MYIKETISALAAQGFRHEKNTVSNIHFMTKQENPESAEICILMNLTDGFTVKPDSIRLLKEEVERKLYFNGKRKVSFFLLIFSDHLEEARNFLSINCPTWIVDTIGKQLMIYEGQPEEYYHLTKTFDYLFSDAYKKKMWNRIPYGTISLIAVNIIVFLYMNFYTKDPEDLLMRGGCYWKYVFENKEYYRLLTCTFLHFDSNHLLGNMVTLGVLGTALEQRLGHIRFSLIYFLSGIGASFISALHYMHHASDTISLSAGASGAIFGILGGLFITLLLLRNEEYRISPVNMIFMIILSIGNGSLSGSIDNAAHIGGLLFGIILTFISCLSRRNELK